MWLEDFERELAHWFDAPSEYIRMSGLFAAGAALAHRVYISSPKKMTTNLYVILLGPAGSGKSTILLEGVEMLEKILPQDDILPVHASAEALERQIGNHAKGGGIHGTLAYDEFQSFIQHIRKEYASNVGNVVLERFQEGTTMVSARTGEKGRVERMTIPGHYLMSFGATDVTHRFAASLKEADSMGGLLSRVLICEGGDKVRDFGGFPPPSDAGIVTWLTDSLKWVRDKYAATPFDFSPEARVLGLRIIGEMKKRIRATGNEFYLSATARIEAYLKKLSLLYAALSIRDDFLIHEEDVDNANVVLSASVNSLQMISEEFHLGEGHYAKHFMKVKRVLYERKTLTRGELLRAVAVKPKELDEIIESLHEQDLVKFERDGDYSYITWRA